MHGGANRSSLRIPNRDVIWCKSIWSDNFNLTRSRFYTPIWFEIDFIFIIEKKLNFIKNKNFNEFTTSSNSSVDLIFKRFKFNLFDSFKYVFTHKFIFNKFFYFNCFKWNLLPMGPIKHKYIRFSVKGHPTKLIGKTRPRAKIWNTQSMKKWQFWWCPSYQQNNLY